MVTRGGGQGSPPLTWRPNLFPSPSSPSSSSSLFPDRSGLIVVDSGHLLWLGGRHRRELFAATRPCLSFPTDLPSHLFIYPLSSTFHNFCKHILFSALTGPDLIFSSRFWPNFLGGGPVQKWQKWSLGALAQIEKQQTNSEREMKEHQEREKCNISTDSLAMAKKDAFQCLCLWDQCENFKYQKRWKLSDPNNLACTQANPGFWGESGNFCKMLKICRSSWWFGNVASFVPWKSRKAE